MITATADARRPEAWKTDARRGRRWRLLVLRLSIVSLALLVPLLGLEAAFRAFGPFLPGEYYLGIEREFDPVLGWRHRPGFSGGSRTSEFSVRFAINSHGLRDEEIPYEKPPGQLRVLTLGDSFLAAPHVNLPQIMPKQLQGILRGQLGPAGAQVVNAGVSGYGTTQEYVYLDTEGYKYSPDVVVVVIFFGNDLLDNARPSEGHGGYDRPFFDLDEHGNLVQVSWPQRDINRRTGLDDFLSRTSTVYNFAQSVMQSRWEPDWKKVSENSQDPNQDFQMYQLNQPRKLKESWAVTKALLVAMADRGQKAGARLLVVGSPSVRGLDPAAFAQELRSIGLDPAKYDPDLPDRLLGEAAADEGLPYLDLLPVLRRAAASGSGDLFFPINKHWTPTGHRVVAQAIYEALVADGLIPPCSATASC